MVTPGTPAAPGVPQIISIAPGTLDAAITFSAPAAAGSSQIISYNGACTDGQFNYFGISTSPTTAIFITGLSQGISYSCTISATNSELTSANSVATTVTIPILANSSGLPSAPTIGNIIPGNSSATVNFTAPASSGANPIVGYEATCTGTKGVFRIAGVSSPIVVTGLTNGTSYSCNVYANNSQGTSPISANGSVIPSATAPGASTVPSSPQNVSITQGNLSAIIGFSAPNSNGGSPITSYTATCSNGTNTLSGSELTSPIPVTGLAAGITYSCSVVATNIQGMSAASNSVTVNATAIAPNPSSLPTTMVAGPVLASIASDGMTTVVVTLTNADGTLFTDHSIPVTFSSACASANTATITATSNSVNGLAWGVYQPTGCTGTDTISVSAISGLSAATSVTVIGTTSLTSTGALGKALFFDKSLSANGQQSCASCHSPGVYFQAPNSLAVQLGGTSGNAAGFRSAPSVTYAALDTPFRFLSATNSAGTANNGANGKLGTPRGGLMWDGRASDVFVQPTGPLLAPHEMANANSSAVLTKLLNSPSFARFNAVYPGTSSSSNPDTVLGEIATAIGTFESQEASFFPFNSKYDQVLANRASFTAQEANGQQLFFNSNKGGCFGCHTPFSNLHTVQTSPFFTDGSYRVLAVPRNFSLPYNNDSAVQALLTNLGLASLLNGSTLGTPNHSYYDLGFCGPFRTDSLGDAALCGAFRTPGLRNVSMKGAYFHNGIYSTLGQVINFYINRDASPQSIYLTASGTPDIPYNDLPVMYQGNREVRNPFTPIAGGRMTNAEIQDLITFMCTLNDGYDPNNPIAYQQPLQCRNAVRR